MSQIQSAAVLILVGIAMNIAGRMAMPAVHGSASVPLAGLMTAWMIASVVTAFFGLYRLIVGMARK